MSGGGLVVGDIKQSAGELAAPVATVTNRYNFVMHRSEIYPGKSMIDFYFYINILY